MINKIIQKHGKEFSDYQINIFNGIGTPSGTPIGTYHLPTIKKIVGTHEKTAERVLLAICSSSSTIKQ